MKLAMRSACMMWLLVLIAPLLAEGLHLRAGQNGTNCPVPLPARFCPKEGAWLDEMIKVDPRPATVFIDIGCNKGTNLVKALERYDPNPGAWSTTAFISTLTSHGMTNFACGQGPHPAPSVTIRDVGADLSTAARPVGYCVEPMPSTIQVLRAATQELGYDSAHFRVIQAAAVRQASPGQTVPFPKAGAGEEAFGISHTSPEGTVDVPAMTVDSLSATEHLSHVDFLHVDVEGWDPDVLAGASQTLSVTRYVMFEVHRDIANSPWSSNTLRSVLDFMSQKSFTCYWATNDGSLINMHACWSDAWESEGWSNVACVKNGDPWAPVFQRMR